MNVWGWLALMTVVCAIGWLIYEGIHPSEVDEDKELREKHG